MDKAKSGHEPLSLLICDVDYFKKYNDVYGHQKGDDCLVKIANCLRQTCNQPGNVIARYGGEEFIMILQNTSSMPIYFDQSFFDNEAAKAFSSASSS